jgi:hypothetical protein
VALKSARRLAKYLALQLFHHTLAERCTPPLRRITPAGERQLGQGVRPRSRAAQCGSVLWNGQIGAEGHVADGG